MEPFLLSTGVVALAETGDKTQLLAFLLAAKFRRSWPIILGITVATLINHGLAAAAGIWLSSLFDPGVLRWVLGVSFLAMAVWILIPDRLDDNEGQNWRRHGVFWTTVIAFFVAEMGDKTQIATVALAARYDAFFTVLLATTAGMLVANVPAVLIGERLATALPVKLVHRIAAGLFAVMGLLTLTGVGDALWH